MKTAELSLDPKVAQTILGYSDNDLERMQNDHSEVRIAGSDLLATGILAILVANGIIDVKPLTLITSGEVGQRIESLTRLWVLKLSQQGFLRVVASHAVGPNAKPTNFYHPREVALEALVRKIYPPNKGFDYTKARAITPYPKGSTFVAQTDKLLPLPWILNR